MKKETAVAAIIVLGVAAFMVGYFLGGSSPEEAHGGGGHGSAAAIGSGSFDSSVLPIGESPVHGSADAAATVVLFTDFTNEAAVRTAAAIHEITSGSRVDSDSVRLVVKFVPGDGDAAREAAIASIYAAEHDRFFDGVFDALNGHDDLDSDAIRSIVTEAGLDAEGFDAALESDAYTAVLNADRNLGRSLGVRRAPGVAINGRTLSGGDLEADRIREVLLGEIASVEEAIERGDYNASQTYAVRTRANAEPVAVARQERRRERGEARGQAREAAAEPARERPSRPAAPAAPPSGDVERLRVPVLDSPTLGPDDALVTIVEFSDFHCPFCGRVVPTVHSLQEEYGDDIRIVFKQNPLPMHANAPLAARATMAAQEQGKFWELHDLFFENIRQQTRADMERMAGEVGLDMDQFRAYLDSDQGNDIIERDQALATAVGARGTPHFFITGRRLRGAQPLNAFQEIINEELALARQMIEDGTAREDIYDTLMEGAQERAAAPQAQRPEPPARVDPPDVGASAARGPDDAPVTIFVFSEFQCPYCSRAQAAITEIEETYGDQVRIVFKSFPLPFHSDAHLASQAALAANEQGQFWEYHDILFENQRALSRPQLEGYAEQLNLDMAQFRDALDSGRFSDQVDAETAEGRSAGVSGTPTFLINGERLVGAVPFSRFQPIIDRHLN